MQVLSLALAATAVFAQTSPTMPSQACMDDLTAVSAISTQCTTGLNITVTNSAQAQALSDSVLKCFCTGSNNDALNKFFVDCAQGTGQASITQSFQQFKDGCSKYKASDAAVVVPALTVAAVMMSLMM
ncbi:hypothetical protein HDU79_011957 [Rhizoclosmatium sp. JEL0117]|nr:hypothetical protein HDU79_011957 [Rhizoclosmatium sp. JEL0117]